MEKIQKQLFAPNLICIGIDGNANGDFYGRMWDPYTDEPRRFVGTNDMLITMDNLYDSWDYPQSAINMRSFRKDGKDRSSEDIDIRNGSFKEKIERLMENRGDEATFIIQVKYRQRATWQGQFVWAEKDLCRDFESAWELIRMMDEDMGAAWEP